MLAALAPGQQATGPHLVLARMPGNPSSRLYDVNAGNGAVAARPRFLGDDFMPLAIAIDPFDRHALIAVDLGNGQSRILRLPPWPGAAPWILADVNGRIVQLRVAWDWLAVAVDDPAGGLLRLPRRGGTPTLVHAQANVTAMSGHGPNSHDVLLAWSGRATFGADSGLAIVDVDTAQVSYGPFAWTNPSGVEITAIADLPLPQARQLLALGDGTLQQFTGGPTPVALATTPPLPAGGCLALESVNGPALTAVAIGGASLPSIYEVDLLSGAISGHSRAIPGEPVDFAFGQPEPGRAIPYSRPCGAPALDLSVSGALQPGGTIVLGLDHAAGPGLALLVAGFDDFAGALPVALPGGCGLQVLPQATLLLPTDPLGHSQHTIAIPLRTELLGAILFAQWLQIDASASIALSAAWSLQVGL